MNRCFTVVFALLLTAGSLSAQAKHPNTREGFWWGIGAGWGSAGASCDDCGDDRFSGFSGNFRLGGTISPSFLLGVETNGWYHAEDNADEVLAFAAIVGLIYPSREGGFYLKVGLGGMNYFAETPLGDLTARAGAASLGAGYEFRVGRNTSIVAYLNSLMSAEAEYELADIEVDTEIRLSLFQLGVGITFH